MNALEPNPILEFNPNQLAEVRKTFNYGDINRLHQDIKLLEDWIKMQHHFVVKEYDKQYLERYLISSKGSIERAKKLFDKICTLRGLMPEYLQGFDIENEFKNFHEISYMGVLSKPTPENYRVLYWCVHNGDAALFEHIHLARYMLVIFQYLYYHDYNAGLQIIFDTRNMTFGMIAKVNPMVIANGMLIFTEGLGLRLRGIHLVSGSKFIDTIVTIVKQGLSKKLMTRLHVHEDTESLFKLIPKAILPKDVGGDLSTAKEICAENFKDFSSPEFMKKMKYMEGALTNESQRLRVTFNQEYSGMPGSFKVLSVD